MEDHSLRGCGGVLPVQHPVGGFAGTAQAAQQGLQLDQAADTGGSCDPQALPCPSTQPDRARGQQSPGLHRHTWLGRAGLFEPMGAVRELGRKFMYFNPLFGIPLKWKRTKLPALVGPAAELFQGCNFLLCKTSSRVPSSQTHWRCEGKQQDVDQCVSTWGAGRLTGRVFF